MRQLQLHRFGYDLLFYSFVLVLARRRWWHTIWTRRTVLHNYAVRIAKCIFILLLLLLLFSKFFYMFFFVVRCRHCCCLRLLRLLFFMQPIFLFSFSSFPSWSWLWAAESSVLYACMSRRRAKFHTKSQGWPFYGQANTFSFFLVSFCVLDSFFLFCSWKASKKCFESLLVASKYNAQPISSTQTHTHSLRRTHCVFLRFGNNFKCANGRKNEKK